MFMEVGFLITRVLIIPTRHLPTCPQPALHIAHAGKYHTLTQCFDAREEPQRLVLGVNIAKCDVTRQYWDRHVPDVDKTAVRSVPVYTTSSLQQSPEESNQSHDQVPGGPSHDQCSDDDVPEPRPTYNYTPYTDYRFVDQFQLQSLAADDAAFLESEGCFSLPGPAALEEFIRQFFKRVHPLVPLLFELGAEMKPHARSQGAVMLTHYTSADDPRSGSLWVTIAIENAMLIDTKPSLQENVSVSLRKRLRWSILLRDRSLCIGLHRCPQVTPVMFQGCSNWLSTEDFMDEMHHSEVYSYESKTQMLMALEQQCQLAVLVTDLAALVFTRPCTSKRHLTVHEFQSLMSRIKSNKESLKNWQAPRLIPDNLVSEGYDAIVTLNFLTHMYFHAARVDLAQFETIILEENSVYTGDSYNNLMTRVSNDLRDGIEGLSVVMEHFSANCHIESFPLSVLAYVSMPLVLAAIDLKLSPNRAVMERRQKRLESLGLIIKHSEGVYDVTDSVAVGTNHILQLAYLTTQNLFFSGEESQIPFDHTATEQALSSSPGLDVISSPANHAKPDRPSNWQEAFVCCPRAYLLISTSVDYSLAMGRLPYAENLPDIVRDLPVLGVIPRLPWTSRIPQHLHRPSVQSSNCTEESHSNDGRLKCIVKQDDARPQSNHVDSPSFLSPAGSPTVSSSLTDDQSRYTNVEASQSSRPTHIINLDYMDFSALNLTANLQEASKYGSSSNATSFEVQTDSLAQHSAISTPTDTFPYSTSTVDSHIFKSFFHEAFEQGWVTPQSGLVVSNTIQ
ncbi:hypothetical protein MYU51_020831 [Penicillium brevicompactum]